MDSLLVQYPFLNTQFLNTVVSGLLAFSLLLVTIISARRQHNLEQRLQEEKLLSDREEKILDIFNTYAECGRVFNTWFSYGNIKVLINPDKYADEKLLNQSISLNRAFNEAKLFFKSGSLIVNQLEKFLHKYEKLRREERTIARSQCKEMHEAFKEVKAMYSKYDIQDMEDLMLFDDARDAYREKVVTDRFKNFEQDLENFIKNDLSDDNFDSYFKPFVNLMTDKEIKSSIRKKKQKYKVFLTNFLQKFKDKKSI